MEDTRRNYKILDVSGGFSALCPIGDHFKLIFKDAVLKSTFCPEQVYCR